MTKSLFQELLTNNL